jgi:hypothetical protein
MALLLAVVGVSGSTVTVKVTNTGPNPENLRVQVKVTLVSGGRETLVSDQVHVNPGQTTNVQLNASGSVQIAEDPEPFGI